MALTLDIIGGTTFVALFTALVKWFLRMRSRWQEWLESPEASPKAVVDQARRQALAEVFTTYEDERQYVATDSRNAAIDDLAIPENDFPTVAGDNELVSLRRRFRNRLRQVEESIAQSLPREAANASSAMGLARYGTAIDHVVRAHRSAWKVRIRRFIGTSATIVGLLGIVLAPSAAVLFSLMNVREVARLPPNSEDGFSDFTILVIAWISLVLILVACVVLWELAIRRRKPSPAVTAATPPVPIPQPAPAPMVPPGAPGALQAAEEP